MSNDNTPPPVEEPSSLDALTRVYELWQKEERLALGSADEHLHDEDLTEAQREFLKHFCALWDVVEDNARERWIEKQRG
jgi:hypothetical protein